MSSGRGCYRLYVYSDGFYTASEKPSGIEPWAVLEICPSGRLRIEAGGEEHDIDLEACVKALNQLHGNKDALLDYKALFKEIKIVELLKRENCGDIDALLLALTLYVSRHRTLTGKILHEALLEVAKRG